MDLDEQVFPSAEAVNAAIRRLVVQPPYHHA
jgi:hypothetical protein